MLAVFLVMLISMISSSSSLRSSSHLPLRAWSSILRSSPSSSFLSSSSAALFSHRPHSSIISSSSKKHSDSFSSPSPSPSFFSSHSNSPSHSRHPSSSSHHSHSRPHPHPPSTESPHLSLKYFYRQIRLKNFFGAYKQYQEELRYDSPSNEGEGERGGKGFSHKGKSTSKINYLRSLLNICPSEEYCHQILHELQQEGYKISESEYLSLIRLSCLNNKPEDALEYINHLLEQGITLKLRNFIPLFSYFCLQKNQKNSYLATNLLLSLKKYSITPEPKHIYELLKTAIHSQIIYDTLFHKKLNKILTSLSLIHYGFQYSYAQMIVSLLTNQSLATVYQQGVLIQSHLLDNNNESDKVNEMNEKEEKVNEEVNGKIVIDNRTIDSTVLVKYIPPPSMLEYQSVTNISQREKNGSPTIYIPHIPGPRDGLDPYTVVMSSQEHEQQQQPRKISNAITCHISTKDSQCTNCGVILKNGYLSPEEAEIAKRNLLNSSDIRVGLHSLPPPPPPFLPSPPFLPLPLS
jgi:hypothetical protein